MYKKLTNDPYDRLTKTHPWVYWDNAFTDDELKTFQNICDKEEVKDAVTIGAASIEEIQLLRRSKTNFFNRNSETCWIFDRFNHIISELNEYYYNFDLNGYHNFQYTIYDSSYKGKYDWHMDTCLGDDNELNDNCTRKLTVVMPLSESNIDFCGGEFQLYTGGNIEHPITPEMRKGRIICFPSFLIHRVKPVILGVRKSIVIWVIGPKFR